MQNKIFATGVRIFLKDDVNPIGDILVLLGKEAEIKALREEYEVKKRAGPFGLEKMAELYGEFSESEVLAATERYCRDNLKNETKETVEKIKEKGYFVGVISANPQFVLEILKEEFALDFAYGTEFDLEGGALKNKVDRFKKAEILKEKAHELGIEKSDIVVLGSSVTDLPMADECGKFIVVGAKDESVKDRADVLADEFNIGEL